MDFLEFWEGVRSTSAVLSLYNDAFLVKIWVIIIYN